MDRLTHYDVNGVAQITPGYCEAAANMQAIQRLAAYEDTGLKPETIIGLCEMDKRSRMAQMLRWEEAEAEGRLIVLPCKVGDTVWFPTRVFDGKEMVPTIGYCKIDEIKGDTPHGIWLISNSSFCMRFHLTEFGKSVFLTREEAEAALKGGGND